MVDLGKMKTLDEKVAKFAFCLMKEADTRYYDMVASVGTRSHFATREEAYKYYHSIINSSDPSMVAITVCVPTPKGIGGHLGFQEKVIERWLPNGKKPILGRYGAAH